MAYHEAGHAVACLAIGRRFSKVTIVPDDKYEGHVKMRATSSRSRRTLDRKLAGALIVAVAGPVTEGRYRKRKAVLDSDPNGDGRAAHDIAAHFRDSEPERFALFAGAVVAARAVIGAHWSTIERVVEILLRQGTMAESEVVALFHPKPIPVKTSGRKMRVILMRGNAVLGKSESFHA